MEIEEKRIDKISLLRITGELDAATQPDAAGAMTALFSSLRSRIIFNVKGIPIVTSSEIAFFIDAARRARELNGDVVISEPTELLRKSLNVLKLDSYFMMFDNDDAAISHFRDAELEDTISPEDMPPVSADWREKLKFWRQR